VQHLILISERDAVNWIYRAWRYIADRPLV
jgi:hypothetical protein